MIVDYPMRFQVQGTGKEFHLLADAAQEAEFLHEEKNGPQKIVALVDEPGYFVETKARETFCAARRGEQIPT